MYTGRGNRNTSSDSLSSSDSLFGTDTLGKLHAIIDFSNKKLTCVVQNTLRTIMLGQIDGNQADRCRLIEVQKPAVNRIDKITSNGQCTGDKQTAGQEKQLTNSLSKHK